VSEGGLLALSTQYGIVSRSNPLSGKVFRGLLDAAGTLNGLGIGNPGTEFSPNVCLCRIFSEKSTAKILWGFTHGEVAVTTANKVADPSRINPAKFSRSPISEQHNGAVADGVWGEGGDVFITAGRDGKVKLWDVANMRCLWTSPMTQELPIPNSFPSRLGFDSKKGIIVATFSDGDIVIWWGLSPLYVGDDLPQVNEVVIPSGSYSLSADVSHLVLDTKHRISLLVHYHGSAHFHRHNVDLITGEVETTEFGEEENRSITSLRLISGVQATDSPFVFTGDLLGSLSVYDWNSAHAQKRDFVQPVRRITAFDDGDAVSSIEWNAWVTATGSPTGIVKVWDSLKFTLLRTFQPHARGYTGDPSIALEREMIVIGGDKITAWKAGPVKRGSNKVLPASKKGKNNGLAKWRRKPDH
jgi:WD40 repeat protein